jgi:hypothetical protein
MAWPKVGLGLRHGGLGDDAFLVIRNENGGRIHRPPVAELPARIGRVDGTQEQVQQPVIGQDVGIIGDLDHLKMPGAARDDLPVGRIGDSAAGKARHHLDHAIDGFEIGLDTPETSARHDRGPDILRLGLAPMQKDGRDHRARQQRGFDPVDPGYAGHVDPPCRFAGAPSRGTA